MAGLTFTVTGLDEVLRNLAALGPRLADAGGMALYKEGNRIMGESVTLVPVETGLLRSTAHVSQPERTGAEIAVELSYGSNGTAPYAAIQHESTHFNHPIGQHHFLSQPFFEATATLPERLAEAIRQAMGM